MQYVIGRLLFEPARGTVRGDDGAETPLRPKTAEILRYLADRAGQIVPRDALIEAVWPGVYVTENGLTQCVAEIRRALGRDEGLLRTLPRRGYLLDIRPPASGSATQPASAAEQSGMPLLAVLPFRQVPPDPTLTGFADILLDGLVGALASMREPGVISANSTRRLSDPNEDIASIARRLGANYVASGVVSRLGGRIRLSIEVAEGAHGAVLWHRAHDLTEAMLFQAPDELAATIAHALVPRVRDVELRNTRRREHDPDAYHLMLDAQNLMYRLDPGTFDTAGEMLRRAALLDPGFAAPHAALGDWYSLRIGQGWSLDTEADSRALEAAARLALDLDGGNARALALLGHNNTILHRRYDTALDLLGRAIELSPNDAETCMWVSPTLAYVGRAEEAVRNAERAIRLSPEDPLLFRFQHFLSIAHYANDQFEEAAECGLRSMRSNRDYTSNLAVTAVALAAIDRIEEARPLVERHKQVKPHFRISAFRPPYQDPAMRERYCRHMKVAGFSC